MVLLGIHCQLLLLFPIGFEAYASVVTSLTGSTAVKVGFQTATKNDGSGYDTANARFTAPIAGWYSFSSHVRVGTTATKLYMFLYKNGASYKEIGTVGGTASETIKGDAILYLAAGDYVEVFAQQHAATQNTSIGTTGTTWFAGARISG